jgi:NAD(P)H-flavin reductase
MDVTARVGLIVAGTGITPALQIIDHYLRFAARDQNGALACKLTLLFVNTGEAELFYRKELEELVRFRLLFVTFPFLLRKVGKINQNVPLTTTSSALMQKGDSKYSIA